MSKLLQQVEIPAKGKVEADFQEAFEKALDRNQIPFERKVSTTPLFKEEDGYTPKDWEIDIVLSRDLHYIPIELKFRHGDQEYHQYDELFERDVKKIGKLVSTYKDVPCGFAIMVTDIPELINNCNKTLRTQDGDWDELKGNYKALVIAKEDKNHTSKQAFAIDYITTAIMRKLMSNN